MSSLGGSCSCGKRSRRISTVAIVSSTLRVVWEIHTSFASAGTSTVRASSGLWTRVMCSGASPMVPYLFVTGMTDQQDPETVPSEPDRLLVHLRHQGAGRIDRGQGPFGCLGVDGR